MANTSPDHDAIAARAFGRHLPVHRTSFARTPENDRKHLEALGEYVESRGSLKPGTINKAIEFKNPPRGVVGHRLYPSWVKPGTIKKALAFVSRSPIEAHGVKGMKSTPWRKTFKTSEHLDKWADANQAEVHATREIEKGIVKPDLKPTLKPEAKEALKDWYRDVYKVTKAFRYTCGNCGHSDAVHTIGGHPQPKSWGCARCKTDTTDIKPLTEAPVVRGKFKTEPVFSDEEKKKVKETGGYFKMLKAFVGDKCPKCGGKMSQGAPHVGGNVKQNECHGCGHIEVTSRDA